MLMGSFEHRLDSKSRLVLPSKFRDKLGDVVVVALGMNRCVSLYSKGEWDKFFKRFTSDSFWEDEEARRFQRVMLSSAEDFVLDGAGRVRIPDFLKNYASLNQDVIIVGLNDHAEVWDKALWGEFLEKELENMDKLKNWIKKPKEPEI